MTHNGINKEALKLAGRTYDVQDYKGKGHIIFWTCHNP